MDEQEFSCTVCGEEFKIDHFAESDPAFCPFCGESLYEEEEDDEDAYEWMDEEE